MKILTKPKPLNDNLYQCITDCFNSYLDSNFLPSGDYVFFNILADHKYLILKKSEIFNYYSKARKILISEELKKEKPNQKRIGRLSSNNRNLSIVFKAKVLAIEDYFESIVLNNKHITEILIKQ